MQRSGASFREILDLNDWDNSVATQRNRAVGAAGESAYGDLLPLGAEGKYFPMLFSRDKIVRTGRQARARATGRHGRK